MLHNMTPRFLSKGVGAPPWVEEIYHQAKARASEFDKHFQYQHKPLSIHPSLRKLRSLIQPPSLHNNIRNSQHIVHKYIPKDATMKNSFIVPLPPYALSGQVNFSPTAADLDLIAPSSQIHNISKTNPMIRNEYTIEKLREAGRLARTMLEYACSLAIPGIHTDEINTKVHHAILQLGAYPSPLNYAGFPKSICTSINEVICHGIPHATHVLQSGDVVKFDVSCFYQGVHGDNCATVIVGDVAEHYDHQHKTNNNNNNMDGHAVIPTQSFLVSDWRCIPYKQQFTSTDEELLFITARRLSMATYQALYAAISTCHPGSCLTDIGHAIAIVAEAYGYDSVRKYRGHGIAREFHIPPFVKHYRNRDYLELQPGMVFTIEPMITEGHWDCDEWESDQWTVVTCDGGRAAQFEHMVLITDNGVDILTCLGKKKC